MHVIAVIVFFLGDILSLGAICPEFINCSSSEKKESCGNNTFYREKANVNKCCPGCIKLKDEYQTCQTSIECQQGLFCSPNYLCEKDSTQGCEYYKRNDEIWKTTQYWNPECLDDGSYAPKQCKGEKLAGKCFCVDGRGNRIFGEKAWSEADDMTCGCSRLVSNISRERGWTSLHCDENGNFEPLQCDGGVCWCALPITGLPYTTLVPMEMMASLPCHNKNFGGAQYHRKCDSERKVQEEMKTLMTNHGTKKVTFGVPNCNFDGSYNRVQTFKDKKRCAYLNNESLTEAVATENADCNCAYDRHVHRLNRVPFMYDCMPNGNYFERQIWDGKVYCVDSDGFPYSDNPIHCSPLSKQ